MAKGKGASGTGTIRKKTVTKPNGKKYTYWEGRFTVGFDPGTGKQIQRSVTGKTQKEVSQKIREATTELDRGTYKEPSRLTVAEWLDTWTRDYLGGVKPLTAQTYTEQVKKHIKPSLGAIKLESLTTQMIQTFYNGLTKGDNPLSPKTVKNIHGVLHKALAQAEANGLIRANPTKACVLPKMQKKEIRPLDSSDIMRLLDAAKNDDYINLFTVAIFTGMRQGELLGLSWDCVDFDLGVITVKQQLQRKDGKYYLLTPKSGKPRRVTPAPLVLDALRNEQKRQNEDQAVAGSVWSNPLNLVFTDASGKNLVRRTVDKHYKKILEQSGLDDHRFHDLRHTFAVTSLVAGDDIKTVQENLGHATAAFTLDVYSHVTDQMRKDSASRMQAYFESLKNSQ